MSFHTGTNEGGIDLHDACEFSRQQQFLPARMWHRAAFRGQKSIEEHLSVLQQRWKKRKVKWQQPSKRNWLRWKGSLVLFRKSRSDSEEQSFPHFHKVFPKFSPPNRLWRIRWLQSLQVQPLPTELLWWRTLKFSKVTMNLEKQLT